MHGNRFKDLDILGAQTGGTPEIMKVSGSRQLDYVPWQSRSLSGNPGRSKKVTKGFLIDMEQGNSPF